MQFRAANKWDDSRMDWMAFIASIVGSLAWPVVLVVLLVLLRKNLGGMAERIEEITLPGGAKAKFVKALDQARAEKELVSFESRPLDRKVLMPDERRLELANRFPEAAVMEAYKDVESVLLDLRSRLDLPPRTNLRGVVRRLVERGVLAQDVQPLFDSVQQARNASAHAGNANRITRGEAIEYMAQAEFLVALFKTALTRLGIGGSASEMASG